MEVAYDARIEPHALLMVREWNSRYTVEVALKRSQHFDVFDQERSRVITD